MKEDIFRKDSLDRLSSPEHLHEYLRVANPSMWIVLVAVIVVIVGIFAINSASPLSVEHSYGAVCHDGIVYVYIPEEDMEDISDECRVTMEGITYHVDRFIEYSGADNISDFLNEGALAISGIEKNSPFTFGVFDATVSEGIHEAIVETEKINISKIIFDD